MSLATSMKPLTRWLVPKVMDRYLLQEMLDYFLLGLVVLTLLAFFSDAFLDFIRDIQQLGIPLSASLTLIGLTLPETIALVLPASSFIGVLLVYNQLNQQYEMIVMRTSGVSLWRLMRPAILLGLLVTTFSYVLGDYIVPLSNKQAVLLKDEMLRRGTLPTGRSSFTFRLTNDDNALEKLIYVSQYDGNRLETSTIIDMSEPDVLQIVQARSGTWTPAYWEFQNANIYTVFQNRDVLSTNHSDAFRVNNLIRANAEAKDDKSERAALNDPYNVDSDVMDFGTLFQRIQKREADGRRVQKGTYVNLWEKLTLPLSCLMMILVAVPLALSQPRQNNQRGFLFSVAILFLFYLIRSVSVAFGRSGGLSGGGMIPDGWAMLVACWLPLLIIAAIGTGLIRRKSRVL